MRVCTARGLDVPLVVQTVISTVVTQQSRAADRRSCAFVATTPATNGATTSEARPPAAADASKCPMLPLSDVHYAPGLPTKPRSLPSARHKTNMAAPTCRHSALDSSSHAPPKGHIA